MSNPDNEAQTIVLTVHGTFAGKPRPELPHWWETNAKLSEAIRRCCGDGFCVRPFGWKDGEIYGPNRESERRLAGKALFGELRKLESAKRPYHLVGHSHGGSVIWHALKESALSNERLDHLQSWTTVATPYLDFGPDGSSWRRLAVCAAAIAALFWLGIWQALVEITPTSLSGFWKQISRLPLIQELPHLQTALGDFLFYGAVATFVLLALFFALLLSLPGTDAYRILIRQPLNRAAEKRAADWYQPLWLGLVHPNDEALAGLKATLIRAPHLVLRPRRGVIGSFLKIRPFRAIDQFAWSTFMRNAQGDDIDDEVVQRVGNAPAPFSKGPMPLDEAAIRNILERADLAGSGVLSRFRSRIEALSDQDDLVALAGMLSGTYDDESLIHTTMFDEDWVRTMIVDQIAGARQPPAGPVDPPKQRLGTPPYALLSAKAASAVGIVAIVAALAGAGYRILIYPETNAAAAQTILARFDDPTFQIIPNDSTSGQALLRAYRLGASLDTVLATANKLRDPQTKSRAYQLLMRELALTQRLQDLERWALPSPVRGSRVPPHQLSDHLFVSITAALDGLTRGNIAPDVAARLLEVHSARVETSLDFAFQSNLYRRMIPIAVQLNKADPVQWAKALHRTDPTCGTWNAFVQEAAARADENGIATLGRIVSACNPPSGAEDRQRMLRRIATVSYTHLTLPTNREV